MKRLIEKITLWSLSMYLVVIMVSCSEPQTIEEISILDLIVQPETYLGKTIVTEGYFAMNDRPRLFISRDDAIYQLNTNSIKLLDTDWKNVEVLRPCTQSYVRILGRFNQELESLQYIYTKDLRTNTTNRCWQKHRK